MLRILVNTRTSGKFTKQTIAGREHMVVPMMPIRGDITMNSVFYPNDEVSKSFTQLDALPAPLGHPTINNVHVSAKHPVANNAFNVGGFLSNPRKKGKLVFANLMLDVAVANQTDDGKALIKRIEEGEKIGVSTGLNIANIETRTGKDDFGKEFTKIGHGFTFDHVAILMNEAAAGEHAGTELILNEETGENEEITVCTMQTNELSTSDMHEMLRDLVKTDGCETYAWVMDIFPDSKSFVFTIEKGNDRTTFKQSFAIDTTDEISLLDDRIEVEKKVEFVPVENIQANEVSIMDKDKLILAIIGNASNQFTAADKGRLDTMSELELVNALSTPVTNEQATEILTNSGHDFEGYESFQANKGAFAAFQADQDTKRSELVTKIVANTEFTEDMLKDKSLSELDVLNNMIAKPTKRAGEGGAAVVANSDNGERAVDYN